MSCKRAIPIDRYRLKELRVSRGLTREGVAKAAGCWRSEIEHYELGQTFSMTDKRAMAIATALHCAINDFRLLPGEKKAVPITQPQFALYRYPPAPRSSGKRGTGRRSKAL